MYSLLRFCVLFLLQRSDREKARDFQDWMSYWHQEPVPVQQASLLCCIRKQDQCESDCSKLCLLYACWKCILHFLKIIIIIVSCCWQVWCVHWGVLSAMQLASAGWQDDWKTKWQYIINGSSDIAYGMAVFGACKMDIFITLGELLGDNCPCTVLVIACRGQHFQQVYNMATCNVTWDSFLRHSLLKVKT